MIQSYTKHLYSLVFVVVATALMLSCGKSGEQAAEQQKPPSDSALSGTEPVVSTNQSELLKLIITPQGGDFRGFTMGDPLSKIKANERFELFEDSTSHVGFTYETENFEAVDIIYYLDKNQALNSIRVDVYLNDAAAVRNLSEQFDTYLSGKYTPEKRAAKSSDWREKGGLFIVLKDVSKGKDFGLRLSMGPKGSKVLSM
jgi:hypothetical protein